MSFSPSKPNFFFAKTRDGLEGVQRRAWVKGEAPAEFIADP